VVLAASAGCTGCGLFTILLTGAISIARAILSPLREPVQAVDDQARQIPLEVFPPQVAPMSLKVPVVILAPDNGVLVGFEVKICPGDIQKQPSSCSSEDDFRIDVGPSLTEIPFSPGPSSALSPRSVMLSPLSARCHPRRDWRLVSHELPSPPPALGFASPPQVQHQGDPITPPLVPPHSPE
jgi:hypothetical protein